MKKILFIFFLLLLSCNNKTSIPTIKYTPDENIVFSDKETELFNLINEYRANNNLPIYKKEALLSKLAKGHNEYMIKQGKPSHDYFYDRYINSHSLIMGEIVAYNYIEPKSMLSAYLSSPKHKAALDNPNYIYIGLSITDKVNTCLMAKYK